jgi:photosystem II stability/assembly factor-like uncharacterized protein
MRVKVLFIFLICLAIVTTMTSAEKKDKKESKEQKDTLTSATFSGLKLRSVGPGLTSGRIIDIAVQPNNPSIYYVGVACGSIWKTTNSGITFEPIFDGQKPFSIGCITIDPNNYNVIWVGSGENNSQRSVAWGDGVYKSIDGGKSWKNMGLKDSKHIGKIVVDPRNSNVVYVAAFGPLWGPGGDRGLYKTEDGGKTWNKILEISENTGVSDIIIDPRNPDVIFAASYQRRRHVWTLINGGPESGLHRSTDAGKTWEKVGNGFPGGELGRIGLAISPVNPDYIWALVESEESGGTYKSTNRGASWFKVSSYNPGSAQYYQELICDPVDVNKIYSLETVTQVSVDGGKTFRALGNKDRHVDDHALWIDPNNTNHIRIGGDGGLYETFDGDNWHHFANLPVTQFYRISCDNTEPFYYVYGGTQDNNTWGGPSRTTNVGGILNDDWFQLVGGDGYQARPDPKNPDIIYCQWQYGNLMRYDRKSGEQTYIQPQPEKGEEHRWNWDTPLIISPHKNTRIYIACNRLYRSEDMGNSWKAVSPDLTRQIDRNQLPVMGKVWNPEAIAKNASTSFYGNIVALSESPISEGLLCVGTDDGLIQISEDGGKNWRKTEKIASVPETTYVSDIFASQHDINVIYATCNNHKRMDFKPYVVKSTDKGKTWVLISSNLPEDEPVWTIYEDNVNPNLLFVGTEFSLYFSIDGGNKWLKLNSGLPSIAVRDLEIQKRENDLIVGTFGRGIYILDNFTPLRETTQEILDKEFHLFSIKDAYHYFQDNSRNKDDQGSDFYRAKNPEYGAVFTYYLKDSFKSKRDIRKENEGKLEKDKKPYVYPTNSELRQEDLEEGAYLIFEISDEAGNIVRRLIESPKKGINRIAWDLCFASKAPVSKNTKTEKHSDFPVLPGKYYVAVYKSVDGKIDRLSDKVGFNVLRLRNTTLPATDEKALTEFHNKINRMQQAVLGTDNSINEFTGRLSLVRVALQNTPEISVENFSKLRELELRLEEIKVKLNGDPSKSKRNENQPPSIKDRLWHIIYSTAWSSSEPTLTAKQAYSIIGEEFVPELDKLRRLDIDLKDLENKLESVKAPWTPGRIPDWKPE